MLGTNRSFAARRNMTTLTLNHACQCGGRLEVLDTSGDSATAKCLKCGRYALRIAHPTIRWIALGDFHLKRGEGPDRRPFDDLAMASHLVESLVRDEWPSLATVVDFGIESPRHLAALKHAVRAGITAYDLDRVMGDGPAITRIVQAIPGNPHGNVEFSTGYDAGLWPQEAEEA